MEGPSSVLLVTSQMWSISNKHPIYRQELQLGCVADDRQGVQGQPGSDGDCGDMIGYVDDGAYSYVHACSLIIGDN